MGRFEQRWSEQQREAIERAYCDQGYKFADIRRIAAAGELTLNHEPLDPFDIPYPTVREIALREAKRRSGKAHSALVKLPAPNASEEIRRRLVSILDHETSRLERELSKSKAKRVDAEHLRKLARAAYEVERLGTPKTPPPKPRGPEAKRPRGDGIGGRIIAAIAPSGINGDSGTATSDPHRDRRINVGDATSDRASDGATEPAPQQHHDDTSATGEAPGNYARSEIARLSGVVVE